LFLYRLQYLKLPPILTLTLRFAGFARRRSTLHAPATMPRTTPTRRTAAPRQAGADAGGATAIHAGDYL
jgi:hypothetical protein